LTALPPLNLSKTSNIYNLLAYCHSLYTIELLDFGLLAKSSNYTFSECRNLETLNIANINSSIALSYSIKLSQAEIVKLLNNLQPVETTQTLTLGATLLSKLTDEQKEIATSKGWTLA
jgi:hypothetical protein